MIKLRVLDRLEVDAVKNMISHIRVLSAQEFHHFISVLRAQTFKVVHTLHVVAVALNPILPYVCKSVLVLLFAIVGFCQSFNSVCHNFFEFNWLIICSNRAAKPERI